jgi:hypothetical protein
LLFLGTPDQVRDRCKFLIDTLGQDGGYIMDASAIMQNDAKVENVRAMTEFTREYGVYSRQPNSAPPPPPPSDRLKAPPAVIPRVPAGVCFPWEERLKDIPSIPGDPLLARRIYEDLDALAYVYIWHMVLSF